MRASGRLGLRSVEQPVVRECQRLGLDLQPRAGPRPRTAATSTPPSAPSATAPICWAAAPGAQPRGIAGRSTAEQISAAVQKGGGRMPGFPNLRGSALRAVVQYVMTGASTGTLAAAGPRLSTCHTASRVTSASSTLTATGTARPGHAQRDRPQHRRVRLENPARRIPELVAKGMKNTAAKLRRPHRHRRRTVFIARTTSTANFARSTRYGQAALGNVMPSAAMTRPQPTKSPAVSTSSSPPPRQSPAGGTAAVYVAYALPK